MNPPLSLELITVQTGSKAAKLGLSVAESTDDFDEFIGVMKGGGKSVVTVRRQGGVAKAVTTELEGMTEAVTTELEGMAETVTTELEGKAEAATAGGTAVCLGIVFETEVFNGDDDEAPSVAEGLTTSRVLIDESETTVELMGSFPAKEKDELISSMLEENEENN